MKRITLILCVLIMLVAILSGCGAKAKSSETTNESDHSQTTIETTTVETDNDDDGEEVDVMPGQIISEDGRYVITGVVDGQILVTAENVTLVLDGATINCPDASAILGKDGNGNEILQNLTIELRGENTITSGAKHGIHGKDDLTITGSGTMAIFAEKDGLHAGDTLTVQDGSIHVAESYEGMEATNIVINGGSSTINSSDDGINATTDMGETTIPSIKITGGEVILYSTSDGIDSNGTLEVTGGTVAIFIGETRDGDGTDTDRGGSIPPTLYGSVAIRAGTKIEVGDLWSFTPTSDVTKFCLIIPGLVNGQSYRITANGSLLATVTATTTIQGMMMGGGNPGGGMGGLGGRM